MTKPQKLYLAFMGFCIITILSSGVGKALIQSQRDQILINVTVYVTPSPIAYQPAVVAAAEPQRAPALAAHFALRAKGSAPSVDSEVIQGQTTLVAQAQSAVKVQAVVTPNPNATLLTSNAMGVYLSGIAGTTVKQSCIYTVKVDTTVTAWTLREGLSGNFTSIFPGSDLANDSYLQGNTPLPTSTPFIVYPTTWTNLAASGSTKTYCVDLTVTIPGNVPGGTYSTNAVYTLYY
jgi:hypothetical protein